MKCVDRSGYEVKQNQAQNKMLSFLYFSKIGRLLLSFLIKPWVSRFVSLFLNLRVSCLLIGPFIKKNGINMSEYEDRKFRSYNDFFSRKIKDGSRKLDEQAGHLIAPCDSKLSVYSISSDARFKIKDTIYSMESLLKNKKLADQYEDGLLLLFRLTVDDYHRYCYIDNGSKSKNYRLPGVFHTVNPIANDKFPIYKENTREYTILKSENFGNILIMEVGALLVGRIVNYDEEVEVKRGQEKGRFEFGGSTIIICLEKGKAVIDEDILINSSNEVETVVRMGERIGKSTGGKVLFADEAHSVL